MHKTVLHLRQILTTAAICLFVGHFVLVVLSVSANTTSSVPAALTRDELAAQIQDKAKLLDTINQQLQSTKESLKGTKQQRLTLQQQLSSIENNISQLNLGIKADEISAQKLSLEIDSLNYDIRDIESSISDKRAAIQKIIVSLQKNDTTSANLLIVFLKNSSLAEGVLEAQGLNDLQSQLSVDIASLRDLHDQYNAEIKKASDKRNGIISAQQDLRNKKIIVQDQKATRQTLLAETKSKESVFQQQLASLQKLQQQIANDIETLDAVLRTKIDPAELPPLVPGILGVPVMGDTANSVTQGYGATTFAKNGYQGHWHNGVDFSASIGTSVLAAEVGTVVAVGNQDAYCPRGAYGKFIIIQHKNNLTTLYSHLSRQIVQKGDAVNRGQIIGYSGMTGYATGPHLHFTVYASPTFYMGPSKVCGQMPYGGDLNPLGYLF